MYTCSFLECPGKQTFELQQQQKLSPALLGLGAKAEHPVANSKQARVLEELSCGAAQR